MNAVAAGCGASPLDGAAFGSAVAPVGLGREKHSRSLWGEIVTGTDATPQELADKYQPQLDEL